MTGQASSLTFDASYPIFSLFRAAAQQFPIKKWRSWDFFTLFWFCFVLFSFLFSNRHHCAFDQWTIVIIKSSVIVNHHLSSSSIAFKRKTISSKRCAFHLLMRLSTSTVNPNHEVKSFNLEFVKTLFCMVLLLALTRLILFEVLQDLTDYWMKAVFARKLIVQLNNRI